MAEALIIRLLPPGSDQPQGEWLLVDMSGSRLGNVQTGDLTHASSLAAGRRVIVLVPGTDVLLAEPELPLKAGARLAQVVPFALEDQLASDVEDMHFAVGRRGDKSTGTPVAAVARSSMEQWLSALAVASIVPDAVYAESAAVPITPNGVTLLIEGMRIHVRRAGTTPAVVEAEPLIEGLQLALASGPDDTRESVTIYMNAADYERDKEMIEGMREFTVSLQVKLLADGALPLLGVTIASQTATNLLQGPYAPKTAFHVSLTPWRYAAVLAGVVVATHLGVAGVQYWKLGEEEVRLDSEIAAVFAQTLPGVTPVNPRAQVEARLAQLRGSGVAGGLMSGLGMLSAAIVQAPETSIEALSYRMNTLDLRVLAPTVDALDRIQNVASERGMGAEIQSATPRGEQVEGRLQFRNPGA